MMVGREHSGLTPADFLTVPNAISALRVVAMPFLVWGLANDADAIAFTAIAVAFLSDGLDGAVARRMGVLSETGKIIDPVADKIAVGTAFVALSTYRGLPWLLTAIVLARDAIIVAMSALVFRYKRQMPSSTRFGQLTVTVLALVGTAHAARLESLLQAANIVCVAVVAMSLTLYTRRTVRILAGLEDGVRLGGGLNWIEKLLDAGRRTRQ
jgi:cardiolipin synthase